MSEYVIQGQTLTGIADAIRAQLGTEQQYTPESMAAAIGSIQGGGTDAEDAIVTRSISGTYKNSRVSKVGASAFAQCLNLNGVKLENALTIESGAFQNDSSLSDVYIPSCATINNNAFYGCAAIKYLSLPKATKINYAALQNCAALVALVFPGSTVCTLTSATNLTGTPIASGTGYIYVPDGLVEQYKVATNWATYASQIKGLSEIPAEVQEWLDQMEAAA